MLHASSRHMRTACSYLLTIGFAVSIFCQAGALSAFAIDITASTPSSKISTGNASFNYVTCDKNQNKDVNSVGSAGTVLAAVIAPVNSLHADLIFDLVNTYRVSIGLPRFEQDKQLCDLASARAAEGYNEVFGSGAIHSGLYERKLPYRVVENMKYGSTEQEVFQWWMNSSLHHSSIVGNFANSCLACNGNLCVQEFTNYERR